MLLARGADGREIALGRDGAGRLIVFERVVERDTELDRELPLLDRDTVPDRDRVPLDRDTELDRELPLLDRDTEPDRALLLDPELPPPERAELFDEPEDLAVDFSLWASTS